MQRHLVQKRKKIVRPLHLCNGRNRASYMSVGPQRLARSAKDPSLGLHGPPVDSNLHLSRHIAERVLLEVHMISERVVEDLEHRPMAQRPT